MFRRLRRPERTEGRVSTRPLTRPEVSTRDHGRSQSITEAMISLQGVTKAYETGAGPFWALKGIDLEIYPGEFVAVVGKSGSGKSTLINMFTGIDHPTGGEVVVAQTRIRGLDEGQMAQWRGRHMGIVFQFFQLLPALTMVENVMLPMDLCNIHEPGERHERAMHLLAQMSLSDLAERYPVAISAGHQQRAAIARALANDPPIVVADEPTGNLDSRTADDVFELFQSLVSDGKTILMVTHDQELANRVPRIVTIADGRIVDEVLQSSGVASGRMLWGKPAPVDIMRATATGKESRAGKGSLSPAPATM